MTKNFYEEAKIPKNLLDERKNGGTLLGRRAGLDKTQTVSAGPTEGRGPATNNLSTTYYSKRLTLSKDFFSQAEQGSALMPEGIRHLPVSSLADAPEPEPREYAVQGLIPYGAATSIYGEGGVAKSMLAMSLCTSLANESTHWLGREIEPCATLYVDFELTQDEQIRRVHSLCRGSGYSGIPKSLHYLSAIGRRKEDVFWSAYAACAHYALRFVVVDSWGIALEGDAKDSAEVIDFFSAYLEPFLAEDIAVLLVDHQAKGLPYQQGTAFGSAYKRNLVRSEIQIEAVDQSELDGTLDLMFRHRKHNFGPLTHPFSSQITFKDGETRVNTMAIPEDRMVREQGIPVRDRIVMALESMGDPMTAQDIADMTETTNSTVKAMLARLKADGKVYEAGQRRGVPTYEVRTREPGPVYYDREEF